MTKIYFFLAICFIAPCFQAQVIQIPSSISSEAPKWIQLMYVEDPNLIEIREAFEAYYLVNPFEKNQHTQYYKRLIKENWLDINEAGFIRKIAVNQVETDQYLSRKQQLEFQKAADSEWEELGPWNYDHEQAMTFEVQSPGSVHVYTVEQSPALPTLVFAGTATAGLWKSTNKGLFWELMTKNLFVNSVYAIALHPTDPQTIWFGEEDGKIWKSLDGGQTWNMTGSTSFQSQNFWTRDLKYIGVNTLLAATSNGLLRSPDGGQNWNVVQAGEHMEIEIHPTNSSILYAVRLNGNATQFYKSTDNGLTWTLKTNGWPSPTAGTDQRRVEISVSAVNPDGVYVWASGQFNNGLEAGFYGQYTSVNAGESFSFTCCGGGAGGTYSVSNPNMMGWSEDGSEEGGQVYYDLAAAVSPTNAQLMYGAGINVWRSENAGQNWELNAHWVTWVGTHTKYRYSHADVHDIKFFQHGGGVDMWVASDGGLYYSSTQGDTLEPRMHGIHGTDFWGFQAGFKSGDVMLGGTYHNGTLIKYKDIYHNGLNTPESGGWLAELGGDNYRGFVNFANSRVAYDDQGSFQFSTEREVRKTSLAFDQSKKCNTSYVTGEYGNYEFLPYDYRTFYSPVGTELFKTTNGGSSFELVHNFGGNKLIQVKVSWANTNHIYVTHKTTSSVTKIMRSQDGGETWIDVTPPQNVTGNNSNRNKYIELDDQDPLKLWCVLMGNQNGNKVFQSLDGGTTWTNITGQGLLGENVISITHHYGTNDGLYVGTRRAVYYKNAAMSDWALFNANLPASTMNSFLQPFYGEGKIRTASQRGVYQCDFYEDAPPVAMISADKRALNLSSDCVADTVFFVDHSTVRKNSATFQWTFEGGIPASSSLENPKVIYNQVGSYDVQLIVSDAFGSDTIFYTDFIQVTNSIIHENVSANFDSGVFPPTGWKLENTHADSWELDWPEDDQNQKVASFPNYWVSPLHPNQLNLLIMPAQNLEAASNLSLKFDVMFHSNGGDFIDTLALVYRSSTTPVWQQFWAKGGNQLHVSGTDTYFWYNENPTLEWRTETVDLNFLQGESCVEIAFSNRGQHGNHIWLDEVQLTGSFSNSINELEAGIYASIFPNPTAGTGIVRWNSDATIHRIEILDVAGKLIQTTVVQSSETEKLISIPAAQAGMYLVRLIGENGETVLKWNKI